MTVTDAPRKAKRGGADLDLAALGPEWAKRRELQAAQPAAIRPLYVALKRLHRSSGQPGWPDQADYGFHRIGDLLGTGHKRIQFLLELAAKAGVAAMPVPTHQIPAAEAETLAAYQAWEKHRAKQTAALDAVVARIQALRDAGVDWARIADAAGDTVENVKNPVKARLKAARRQARRRSRGDGAATSN